MLTSGLMLESWDKIGAYYSVKLEEFKPGVGFEELVGYLWVARPESGFHWEWAGLVVRDFGSLAQVGSQL